VSSSSTDATPAPTPRGRRRGRRLRGDDGFVGGAEAFIFGVVVFVAGALLMANAWAVVDAKMAVSSAARETARTYVESDGDLATADVVGRSAFAASTGLDPARLTLTGAAGTFERCGRITVTYRYRVPALSLPGGIGWGSGFEVSASHSEIVDPYRAGLEGEARCLLP
jgi:hypothetical protein